MKKSIVLLFFIATAISLFSCGTLNKTDPLPPDEVESFFRSYSLSDEFIDMLEVDRWVEIDEIGLSNIELAEKYIGQFYSDSNYYCYVYEGYAILSTGSYGEHYYTIPSEASETFKAFLAENERNQVTLNTKLNFTETDLRLKFYLSGELKARLKPDEWVEREAPETEGELIAKLNIKFSDEKEDYFLYVYDTYVMVYVEPTREGQYDRVYYALPAESVEAFREYWTERTK